MTLREIDSAIASWNGRLATAAQNLMDLQSHPTYHRLTSPNSSLSGKTATQAALAVNTLSMLLRYYELLQGTISRAEEMRRDLPVLFGSDERAQEIKQLLEGRSIKLPTVQIPLGKRGLLSGVENVDCIAPSALLNTMANAFEEAKAIVLAIDAAWESLGHGIEAAEQRIASLSGDLELLNETERSGLREAEAKLNELRHAAASDPVGTSGELTVSVTARLSELQDKWTRRKQLRDQVSTDLKRAETVLEEVRNGHQEACQAYAEACEKIVAANGPRPKPDTEIEALAAWLQRLRTKCNEGAIEPVEIGLRNWTKAAREVLNSDRAAADGNRRLLETRSELRGRLDALKAKARAHAMAEEEQLMALAEQARELLYSRPSALDRAAVAVSEYERKLNFLIDKSVRS
jgi:hypothetical protein